jgi:hypothetical protein
LLKESPMRTRAAAVLILLMTGCGASGGPPGEAPEPGPPAGSGGKSGAPAKGGAGGSSAKGGAAGAADAGPAPSGSGGASASGGSDGRGGSGAGGAPGTGGSGGAAPSPDAGADASVPRDVAPPPPPGAFRHPGVLLNQAQLDFVRAKIAAGEQPWKAAFDKAKADNYGSLAYAPKPQAMVECGPYSMPNIGCAEEANDSIAAYTHALLWAVGGDEAHAKKSIEIMNGWARVFRGHENSNGPLQAGWYGAIWPRAGDIIRHTYAGWPAADVARFSAMLKDVYLPRVINGSGANGNWELSMIEATMHIAVFLDDKTSFDKAVAMWRRRVPAYFYMKADGPTPVRPPRGSPSWYTSNYVEGLCQETCRDFLHTQLGFGAAINAAETAFQQGVDLYGAESARLRTTMEFHADYLLGKPAGSLCGGSLNLRVLNTWQIAYNHYNGRLGLPLPLTGRLITEKARAIDPTYKHMSWETHTHADVGAVGAK